jgi:hypothetical protein
MRSADPYKIQVPCARQQSSVLPFQIPLSVNHMLGVAVLVSWVSGVCLVEIIWPDTRRGAARCGARLVRLTVGLGLGLGMQSVVAYMSLVITGSLTAAYWVEWVLGAAAGGLLWVRYRPPRRLDGRMVASSPVADSRDPAGGRDVRLALSAFLVLSVSAAMLLFTLRWSRAPYGYCDAWTMWTLKAAFLRAGGPDWGLAFRSSMTLGDYPLLVPLTTARFWQWTGAESLFGPFATALLFSFATVGLLVGGLSVARGRMVATVGGIGLIGVPPFLAWGAALYADVPLAFFLLAAYVLWACLERYRDQQSPIALLIGAALGAALWTKNEGTLMLVSSLTVMALGRVIQVGLRPAVREMAFVLAGMAPFVLVWLHFKVQYAPPNGLLGAATSDQVRSKLADPDRWRLIAVEAAMTVRCLCPWWLFPAFGLLLGAQGIRRPQGAEWLGGATLILVIAGYYYVYLTTPYELRWHLGTSLDRLMVQLLPAALFATLLYFRPGAPDPSVGTHRANPVRFRGPAPGASNVSRWLRARRVCSYALTCLLCVAAVSAIRSFADCQAPKNWRQYSDLFVGTRVTLLRQDIPAGETIGYFDPQAKTVDASIPYLAARYFLAPRQVAVGLKPRWVIALHATGDDAARFASEHQLILIRDLQNGLRLYHRESGATDSAAVSGGTAIPP